jgi:hypothetical protein
MLQSLFIDSTFALSRGTHACLCWANDHCLSDISNSACSYFQKSTQPSWTPSNRRELSQQQQRHCSTNTRINKSAIKDLSLFLFYPYFLSPLTPCLSVYLSFSRERSPILRLPFLPFRTPSRPSPARFLSHTTNLPAPNAHIPRSSHSTKVTKTKRKERVYPTNFYLSYVCTYQFIIIILFD